MLIYLLIILVEKTRDNVLEADDDIDNIYEDGVDVEESNYPTITGFNIFPAILFSIIGLSILNTMLKAVFSAVMLLLMIFMTIYSIKNFV
jgi:UDP-N-acetylmuramyl pentapeptide phosphotransferase/UDP-N-acetylglucosamine-1-phosphate transferase